MTDRYSRGFRLSLAAAISTSFLLASETQADTITDWNKYAIWATKGASSLTTGTASNALNSNVSTRIEAITARAVYDAVNAINQFNKSGYYCYKNPAAGSLDSKSAAAAAAQAAHDVLFGTLPTTSGWAATRSWLDAQLAAELLKLGVSNSDPGVQIGKQSAAAALAARSADGSSPRTTYTPPSNIDPATGAVNATGNPGIGIWRPSNGGAGLINPITGAPTGFDAAGKILAAAGIDYNWKDVTPFSLTPVQKNAVLARVPGGIGIWGNEYNAELDYVKSHGQEISAPTSRTNDQTLQALYYKSDAELFTNEAARLASVSRNWSLNQNAKLFAALANALADARITAFQSKYTQQFWRPITAINTSIKAVTDGSSAFYQTVTTYDWKPLASTPSHPSNTSGHSATAAAGAEILRSFFKTDQIVKNAKVNLTTLPWLIGTNNGTGKVDPKSFGGDATTRSVTSFSQLQIETGRSRVFLGVHFPNDDYQGQSLGLKVADTIIKKSKDPAVKGIGVYTGKKTVASPGNLEKIFISDSLKGWYGYFALKD